MWIDVLTFKYVFLGHVDKSTLYLLFMIYVDTTNTSLGCTPSIFSSFVFKKD